MSKEFTYKKENTPKIPLGVRLKYMFSGYKTQMFWRSASKIVPICLLAILVVLVVIYIFLHPLDKIKLRYFFSRDCTIEVMSNGTLYNTYFDGASFSNMSEVRIDGNWIEANDKYYNLDGGEVYCYYIDASGKWQSEPYEIGTGSLMDANILLNKDNYVRDKKNPFVWKLKQELDQEILDMDNICIKRFHGAIAIVGETKRNTYNAEIYLCFRKFGTTKIELPWED